MGLFFTSKKNKLSEFAIDKALNDAGILENSDKKEIKKLLKKRRSGGITKRDVIEVTRKLKNDTKDSVDRVEAEAARRSLLNKMDEK